MNLRVTRDEMIKVEDFFDVSKIKHTALFKDVVYVWDILKKIKPYLSDNIKKSTILGNISKSAVIEGNVHIGKGSIVEDGVFIKGPSIIGENCEIRHNAYIRGNVIIGDDVVIGNSCEVKHSVVFNNAQIPHLAYVGNSIVGYKAHLGAGVIISNVKLVKANISVKINDKKYDTGLLKLGAIIGDEAEIGCNAVLNPGSIIGKRCIIYSLVSWRGFLPNNSIVKLKQNQVIANRI